MNNFLFYYISYILYMKTNNKIEKLKGEKERKYAEKSIIGDLRL